VMPSSSMRLLRRIRGLGGADGNATPWKSGRARE
jgi:hypothetical protein